MSKKGKNKETKAPQSGAPVSDKPKATAGRPKKSEFGEKELREMVKEAFACNKVAKSLFGTIDGKFYLNKNAAENAARHFKLSDFTVFEFKRK